MRLPAIFRLTARNILVNTDPGTMFFMLGIPAFYLLVMGLMLQVIIPNFTYNGVSTSYITFLAPGIVGMQAFTAGSIGGSMLWADRRWGMFEQLLVGPFRRSDYLMGIMLVAVFFSLAGSAIMLVLAYFISPYFNITVFSSLFMVFSLIVGAILFTSMFLIISVLVRSMQAYNTITILLFFLIDFASTAFYPISSSTPFALRWISSVNPLTLIVNIVRDSMVYGVSGTTYLSSLVVLLVTMVLFVVSLKLYRNVRTGI